MAIDFLNHTLKKINFRQEEARSEAIISKITIMVEVIFQRTIINYQTAFFYLNK